MTEIRQSRDAIKEEKLDGEKSRGTLLPYGNLKNTMYHLRCFYARVYNACEIISQLSRRLSPDKRKKTHTVENYSVDLFLGEGRRWRRDGVRGEGGE